MAINNQATLRTAVADWLNRTDLSNDLIDNFIEIGESRIYDILRVPTLEVLTGFSVTAANSRILIPNGFTELIELRKVGVGTCSVVPATNITRALCTTASGTWTDSDKDDDVTLRRVDGHTFHNNKLNHAFTREINSLLITDNNGEQKASGEYVLKYYGSDVPIGTVVAGSEVVPWILGTEYEVILFAALAAGSIYLGDIESQSKFDTLTETKIISLNEKTKKADLKGGIFTANFSSAII